MLLPALRHSGRDQTVISTSMADKPTSPAALQQSTAFEGNPAQTTSFLPIASSQFPATPTKESKELRAVPISTTMAAESKKPLAISNLMSPPEQPPFDSFAQGATYSPTRAALSEQRNIPHPPLSPPISPFTKPTNTIDPAPTLAVVAKDPILYPGSDVASSPPEPLFSPSEEQLEARRAVDDHITARPATLFREATPPRREHYELALYFKSAVMQKFRENPGGWLRKERELLARDRKNGFTRARLPTILPAVPIKTSAIKPLAGRSANPNKIKKPRPSTPSGPTNGARPIRATPAGPPRQPAVRQTIRVSSTPEPRMRTVAPNREDKDFNSLENYCPPLSSLPNKPNSLKVDWKGNALDLSHDPYAHLLHPDELLLAAGLRLDCATYLTSKRRIFIRRLECARIGKEFRKTDAQQACKIDVNKASKLWTAYDKVGWLDIQWMKQYL